MKIGKIFALEAKKNGICKEWFADMLKQNNLAPLCAMYFKGDDWAMEKDFPSISLSRTYLKGRSEEHGLHTDFVGDLENKQQIALFGDSDAKLNYNEFFAGVLIVRHNSKAKITASGNTFLVINLLDSAFVEIEATENAKVIIYQYGNKSNFRITGNVEIKEGSWEK